MTEENFKKLKIPNTPGVYFFKRGKDILYIGKATSLKDRVKSYFRKDLIETRGPVLVDMVFKSADIKWQETDSMLEALILEASLIKKYQPRYNTKEKSDKSFLCVVITSEILPRVIILRARDLESYSTILTNYRIAETYGPFTNGSQLREAIKIIRRIFPFLDEKSKNYLEFYKQINLVPDLNDYKLYLQNIKNIRLFFEGKKKRILQNLKKKMRMYAKTHEFEKAGEIKRQIFALQHINDVALIKSNNLEARPKDYFRMEAYDVAHMGGKNMVGVMVVLENGEVSKNEYRKFKIKMQDSSDDTAALLEVLSRRLVHKEWRIPDLIVVDGGIAQINVAKRVLAKIPRVTLGIRVIAVVKDKHHKPYDILGEKEIIKKYKMEILLANSEAHRFAISYHKKMRAKNFLQ